MSSGRQQVVIEGLRVATVVGVHAWEREVTQELLFDLWLDVDFTAAARSDDLADALDYAAVSERVRAHTTACQPRLLERLAVELADLLEREFGVQRLRLHIRKPGAVPDADAVGVVLERDAG